MRYIFPFKEIPIGSHIILYGASQAGYDFYRQIKATNYCEIVLWVDRQYEWWKEMGLPVDSPNRISDKQFDLIVITAETQRTAESIMTALEGMGVGKEKIFWKQDYFIDNDIVKKYDAERVRRESDGAVLESPVKYLNMNSLDLVVRVLYARDILQGDESSKHREMYRKLMINQHGGIEPLEDMVHAYFTEYDMKRGWKAFDESFRKLVLSVDEKGLLREYFIPVDNRGDLINGRHRVSSAIAVGVPIWTRSYKFDGFHFVFDKQWLKGLDFTDDEIEAVIEEYNRIKKGFKVSVIIPSLNVYDYIVKALDSVRNQSLSDIEIICVDGGSTDGTWEIIKKAAQNDTRITTVKCPVKSYGYQVNTGIRLAKGEYIAILESDDYVDSDMYQNLYAKAIEGDYDYVKCNYSSFSVNDSGEEQHTDYKVGVSDWFYTNGFKPSEHPEAIISDWYLWNSIYKKSFIEKNHIFFSETPGAAFQDIGFIYKTEMAAEKVIYFNKSLYRYRNDRDGASTNLNRSLEFIRVEYGAIIDDLGDNHIYENRVLLYVRMIKHFVQACLEYSDEQLRRHLDIYIWFADRLTEAKENGWIAYEYIPAEMRTSFGKLMESLDEFIVYRNSRKEVLDGFCENIGSFIIFGCGYYGRKTYYAMKKRDYRVIGFMDNSSDLQGKEMYGISIISPDKIPDIPADTGYLIANEKHAAEIQNQIITGNSRAKVLAVELEMLL